LIFEFVSTLSSQISWSNHLSIMSKAKTAEERHFYMTSCLIRMYCKKLQELINMPLLEEND
jgi:hypothetical protein